MSKSALSSTAENLPRYVPELDGLRAIACVSVMCFHAAPTGILGGGFLGVDLFFVLSGFLITTILIEEKVTSGRIDIWQFYLQRFFRLVPALLLFLVVYACFAPLVWPGEPHLRDAALAAAYVSNYTYPISGDPGYIRHTWSLAVEEQFYLIWPIATVLLLKSRSPIFILCLIWSIITLYRLSLAAGDWIDYYFPLHTHASGLIAGAILALLFKNESFKPRPLFGWISLAIIVLLAFAAYIKKSTLTITFAEVATVGLVASIMANRGCGKFTVLTARPMVLVGKLSYGLYLWHFPIAYYLRQETTQLASIFGTLLLSFVCALISYWTVEKWGRSVKASLRRRKNGCRNGTNSFPDAEPNFP